MNYSEPLICSQYYHLFNHAVGKDNLFVERENYLYFLKKFGEYADPICQTYSYCLMPNHFHFLVRIRDEKELLLFYRTLKKEVQKEEVDLSKVVMQRFSNLFNAYAKAFNKKYRRRGSLFIDYLKRKHVKEEAYFSSLYITSITILFIMAFVKIFLSGSFLLIALSYLTRTQSWRKRRFWNGLETKAASVCFTNLILPPSKYEKLKI